MALVGSDEELAARPPVELTIEDASIAATDYLPGAELEYAWRDDGPAACAGVELLLREGARERRVVLCASHAFAASFEGDGYALLFPAEADAGRLAQRARRIRTRVAAIVRPGDGSAKVTVFHPDGSQEDRQIRPGEPGTLLLGGREVKLEIVRFLTRAWRATTARPARPGVAPPAVKLEVRIGNWHGWQWVSQYHSVRPIDPADPSQSRLLLPGGKTLFLQFAPRHRPLPKAFTIAQLRYLTLPGSAIPRDYICSLAVLDDAGGPAEYLDCRLNRPADLGAIRLYQHEWRPDPEDPSEVIFMVRARPGIWAVWLGCGLICAGIPVAFYVGPLRRRQEGRTQP